MGIERKHCNEAKLSFNAVFFLSKQVVVALCRRMSGNYTGYKTSYLNKKWHTVCANNYTQLKTAKNSYGVGEIADAHDRKQKNYLRDFKQTACSTMRENKKTALTNFIIVIASVPSKYNADFKNMEHEHLPRAREDLRKIKNLAFADYQYNIRIS